MPTNNESGSWWSDPQTWAAIASIASQYQQSQQKGNVKFKPVPQTPEEMNLYNYAATLAGVPNVDGTQRPGAMPTMSYVGPQIQNMLGNYNSMFADYKPLNYLDPATGKQVERQATPFKPFDFSKALAPWAASVGGAGGAGGAGLTPGQITAAQWGWDGKGEPPWSINNPDFGGAASVGDSTDKKRLPQVIPDYGGWVDIGSNPPPNDTATQNRIMSFFSNYASTHPDWMKDLVGTAGVIAGFVNLPVGIVISTIAKLIPKQGTGGTTAPPPQTGYNPTNPSPTLP